MRLGVFGGTFDPVHLGHLILAEQCREQGRLDQVLFIPAARPPHKQGEGLTRFDQRVEMLELALAGNPAFRVETLERDRQGPSYTADTLANLRRLHPNAQLFFLIGSDTLAELHTWHQPGRIVEQATLLVMPRPDFPLLGAEEVRQRLGPGGESLRMEVVEAPLLISLSSSDLRRRAAEGRSLRYLLPRAVECYITEKRLYRKADEC